MKFQALRMPQNRRIRTTTLNLKVKAYSKMKFQALKMSRIRNPNLKADMKFLAKRTRIHMTDKKQIQTINPEMEIPELGANGRLIVLI
jgi:23S rRNA maturation mini-RNase III